jgi:hypothetical protein
LQQIIENGKRLEDDSHSGKGRLKEVQQALGLSEEAAIDLGAILQHHDIVMNNKRQSTLEGIAEVGKRTSQV